MKVLITGSNGALGSDLAIGLGENHEVVGWDIGGRPNAPISVFPVDITNPVDVMEDMKRLKPDAVIHAAAYRNADLCESEPEEAFRVNCKGTEHVARASEAVGAKFFFISSDYVFDGTKKTPYHEDDRPNPLSVYGRNKFESEEFLKSFSRSAWVIRISWLFGTYGKSFFRSILHLAAQGSPLRVVNDQLGAPTYTCDLAQAFDRLIREAQSGQGGKIYHLTNTGVTSWYEAAQRLLSCIQYRGELAAVSSEELNWPAKRPKNSTLSTERIFKDFGIRLRPWEEAFDAFWKKTLEAEWGRLLTTQKNCRSV